MVFQGSPLLSRKTRRLPPAAYGIEKGRVRGTCRCYLSYDNLASVAVPRVAAVPSRTAAGQMQNRFADRDVCRIEIACVATYIARANFSRTKPLWLRIIVACHGQRVCRCTIDELPERGGLGWPGPAAGCYTCSVTWAPLSSLPTSTRPVPKPPSYTLL